MATKQEKVRLTTPEGRVTNHSLFEKDTYKDERGKEGTPAYKVELVLDDDDALAEFEDAIVAAAVDYWGEDAAHPEGGLAEDIRSPLIDGDEVAKKRERKGKAADAYEGKVIIRAHTIFNSDGEDAPGGVYVVDEKNEEIDFANRRLIYRGCYGRAVVTVHCYDVDGLGVALYLEGFQRTRDGDRLGGDRSGLFSPVMGAGSEKKGRRSRGKG